MTCQVKLEEVIVKKEMPDEQDKKRQSMLVRKKKIPFYSICSHGQARLVACDIVASYAAKARPPFEQPASGHATNATVQPCQGPGFKHCRRFHGVRGKPAKVRVKCFRWPYFAGRGNSDRNLRHWRRPNVSISAGS